MVIPEAINQLLPSGLIAHTPVDSTIIYIPLWIELVAVVAGALYGALSAVEKDFDLFGVIILAAVTGLGGSILRDLLLQNHGIYAFQKPVLLIAGAIAGVVVFYFHGIVKRAKLAMFLTDTVSLGLFAVIGADKGIRADLTFIPVVILGLLTCVGGGVIRDILTGEPPLIFRKGNLYGIAGISAAVLYTALVAGPVPIEKYAAMLFSVGLAVGLRLLSHKLNWQTKSSRDLTPELVAIPKKVLNKAPLLKPKPKPKKNDDA